jgi:hypothetical protein
MTSPKWQIISPAAILVMATAGVTPVAAQSLSQPRIEISANVGAQTGVNKFTQSHAFTFNGETETLTANHDVKSALGFNVGAAARLIPQIWVGVQYAKTDMKPSASITAVIPHPLVFNAPRTVQGSKNDVADYEQNVHVDLMYALPVRAIDVKVMGGPTFFNLKHDFVSAVTVNESYPFDTAAFASATTKRLSKGAVGYNAGVDISRPLSSRFGIGALIRYSRADAKFDETDIGKQTVKAGGVEATAGVRLRF